MSHPREAARFLANQERAHWHDGALWFVRAKRDRAARAVPDWEELRTRAEAIKAHTLSRLADYLEQFEKNAERLGAHVQMLPVQRRRVKDVQRCPASPTETGG